MDKQAEKRLYMLIGERISEARTERGYTQQVLADAIGLTRTSIVNIEKGRQRLPLHILFPIAMQLKVNPRKLIPTVQEIQLPASAIEDRIEHIQDQTDLNQAEKESVAALLKKTKHN